MEPNEKLLRNANDLTVHKRPVAWDGVAWDGQHCLRAVNRPKLEQCISGPIYLIFIHSFRLFL